MTDAALSVAVRAARNAAAVIEDAARDLKQLPAFSREHGEIVAAADAEAENAIATTLLGAFPDHAIIGKPSGAYGERNVSATYRWIVDAIDGSSNFAHGYPHYAISIALAHGPELTHAVVLDPVRDEMFTAIKNQGAQIDGVPTRISSCTEIRLALLGTAFPARSNPSLSAYLPILDALVPRCGGLRRSGACALDLAYVAAGRLDGFFVMGARSSDVAAGALLVHESGGMVGDFAGSSDYLRGSEVIAAAPGVFSPLREVIAGARG